MTEASNQRPRILVFDGGGVRVMASLSILDGLMKEVGVLNGTPDVDIKPCEYFDLICGTSAGGIAAIMLGRLRMTVPECISAFERLGKKIFKEGKKCGPRRYRFRSSYVVDAVKEVLRERGLPDDEPLFDSRSDRCRTFVTTLLEEYVTGKGAAIYFRTYSSPSTQYGERCTIWQAIRATTAAPLVFKPIKIDKHQFIDAATGGFNNPAHLAEEEAEEIWPQKKIEVLLSLGTGERKARGLGGNLFRYFASLLGVLKDMTTNSEYQTISVKKILGEEVFFRLNVGDGVGDIKITDWKKSNIFESSAKRFLRREDNIPRVRTLAKKIIGAPPVPRTRGTIEQLELYDREHGGVLGISRWSLDTRIGLGGVMMTQSASGTKYSYTQEHIPSAYEQIQRASESYSKAKEIYNQECLNSECGERSKGKRCYNDYEQYLLQAETQITKAFLALIDEFERVHVEYIMIEADLANTEQTEQTASLIKANKEKSKSLILERGEIIIEAVAVKEKLTKITYGFRPPGSILATSLGCAQLLQNRPHFNLGLPRKVPPREQTYRESR